MTLLEKTGKRNLHYSKRHRIYGPKMAMMDIDSVEFDVKTDQPVCFIETKYGLVEDVDLTGRDFDRLCNVAKDIPLLLVIYYPLKEDGTLLDADEDYGKMNSIQYYVCGVNDEGRKLFKRPTKLTEREWVEQLYKLRGEVINPSIGLCDTWVSKVKIPLIIPR